ncbi:hypothetical protein TrST_g2895 [Triparma strigata]|uniref:PH domain-containing protein n=1 Tax=Triparma strigata TaxID=1606541 RepID=A0A9W7BTU8_9STRA|nr:hypothetical protein TrST_g2895 [Triparma strigata]
MRMPPSDDRESAAFEEDETTLDFQGDLYVRKYVEIDVYLGLRFRKHQPSFLSAEADEEEEEDPEEAGIISKNKDSWNFIFGGDVSLTKMEAKSHIKAKDKRNKSKKLYPLMLLTKVDDDSASSWVTVASETKEELHKWMKVLKKCRDLTQYLRACRDCNQATPLTTIVNACTSGSWRSLKFENVRLTNSSICALAVFLKRQVNAAKAKTKDVTEIIINNCGFSDDSCEVLLSVFESIPSLERVRLPHNEITDNGVRYISESPVFNGALIELDLSHNHLTSASARRLATLIRKSKGLKKIDLSNNQIKIDGSVPLLTAIRDSKCPLEVLCLNGNELGDLGAEIVANILKFTKSTLRILRLSHTKIGSVGMDSISNAVYCCEAIQQVKMHGNLSGADSVGYLFCKATHHHFNFPNSRLMMSGGGCDGNPHEQPVYGRQIKGFFANIERNTKASNLRLRRRGLHIVRSKVKHPIRVSIWLHTPSGEEIEASIFRVRLANILNIKPVEVHILSTLKENSSTMCVTCEICAEHKIVKTLSLNAAQNDPKLRALGVLRVVEFVPDTPLSKGKEVSGRLSPRMFDEFLNTSLSRFDVNEEKKDDANSDPDMIVNAVHPQIEIVELPKLLPSKAKDLNYKRNKGSELRAPDDEESSDEDIPPPPSTAMNYPIHSKIASIPGPPPLPPNSAPPPRPPPSPPPTSTPIAGPTSTAPKSAAGMANAYNLAADFFSDDNDIAPPPLPPPIKQHSDNKIAGPVELDDVPGPPPPRGAPLLHVESSSYPVIEEDEGENFTEDRMTLTQAIIEEEQMMQNRPSEDLFVPPPPPPPSTPGPPSRQNSSQPPPGPPPPAPPAAPPAEVELGPTPNPPTPALRKKPIPDKMLSRGSTKDYSSEWGKSENSDAQFERERGSTGGELFSETNLVQVGGQAGFGGMAGGIQAEKKSTFKEPRKSLLGRKPVHEEEVGKDLEGDHLDDFEDDPEFEERKRALTSDKTEQERRMSQIKAPAMGHEQSLSGFDDETGAVLPRIDTVKEDDEDAISESDESEKKGAVSDSDNDSDDDDAVEVQPVVIEIVEDENGLVPRESVVKARERAATRTRAATIANKKKEKRRKRGEDSDSEESESEEAQVRPSIEEQKAAEEARQNRKDNALLKAVTNLADQAASQETEDDTDRLPAFMVKRADLCKAVGTRDEEKIQAAIQAVKDDYLHGGNKWQQVVDKAGKKKTYYWNRITGKTQFERPEMTYGDGDLNLVNKMRSHLQKLKQDFTTLHVTSSPDPNALLEQYQSFLCRCAVLGYNGTEATQAYTDMQKEVLSKIDKKELDPKSQEYGVIHIKSQIVWMMMKRGEDCTTQLTQFLEHLKSNRANNTIADENETPEESIARTFLKRTAQIDRSAHAASVGQTEVLKTVENVILQSYLLNYHSDYTKSLEKKRYELGVQASQILKNIFEAAKKKNITILKKNLAEAKRIGFTAPGLQDAENLLTVQQKASNERLAKEAISRAAKAIKGGRLAASNTAELIPVLRILEKVNLETDKTTQANVASVNRYLSKLVGHSEEEKMLLGVLTRGDPEEISDFLDGKGDGEMIVSASITVDMEEWISCINKAGAGAEDVDDDSSSSSSDSDSDEDDAISKMSKKADGVVWKKGMLWKMSRGKKVGDVTQSWKERYCVLQGRVLTYYQVSNDKKTKTKKGQLLVHGAEKVPGDHGRSNCFVVTEGRDVESLDTMLVNEARKQLLSLQKEVIEAELTKGINARSVEVLKLQLAKVQELGADIKEDIMEEANEILNEEERVLVRVELKSAVEKCNRNLIAECLKKCEQFGVEMDTDIVLEAKEMVKYTEIELSLQRMRVALEHADGRTFDVEMQSVKQNAMSHEIDREALAALMLQHATRLFRDNMLEGYSFPDEVKHLRQVYAACRGLRVEIAPMQLAKLGLIAFGENAEEDSKRQMQVRASMFGGLGNMEDSPYSIDKCILLKELDVTDEKVKKNKRMTLWKKAGNFAKGSRRTLAAVSNASGGGSAKGGPMSLKQLKSVYTEPRLEMASCLTSGMKNGEARGLEFYKLMKTVVLQGAGVIGLDREGIQGAGHDYAQYALDIVTAARAEPAVANEVFLQLCKIMTPHDSDGRDNMMNSAEVRLRAWVLMAFMLRSVEIDGTLLVHLKYHLNQLVTKEGKAGKSLNQKMLAAMGKSQRRSMMAGNSFLSTNSDTAGRSGSVRGGLGQERRGSGVFYENKKEVAAARKETSDLVKASRYCMKCIYFQEREGAGNFCRDPQKRVAENLFEEERLSCDIMLMNGDVIPVPTRLIFVDTAYPLIAALEAKMGTVTDLNVSTEKFALQRRWNGFSFFAVSSVEKVSELSMSPQESTSLDADVDITWMSTLSEFRGGGEKRFVLRVRSLNRGEVRENNFFPPVLQDDDYNKDVMTARALWEDWLTAGVKGVSKGLPKDHLRIELMYAEELRKVEKGVYAGAEGMEAAKSYLFGLKACLNCTEKQWTDVNWMPTMPPSGVDHEIVKNVVGMVKELSPICPGHGANQNKHLEYLLKRAWLDYAKTWTLFGGHFFNAKLKRNKVVALDVDVVLCVNGDGVSVLVENEVTKQRELLFSCRHADINDVQAVESRDDLVVSFAGLKLDLEIDTNEGDTASNIVHLVSAICSDTVWEGSFEDGTGIGSATSSGGVIDQHELMGKYLLEFPILPIPPEPPKLAHAQGFFLVPKSDRAKWVEDAKEKERQEQQEAMEQSQKAAIRAQQQMESAQNRFEEMDDEEDEEEKEDGDGVSALRKSEKNPRDSVNSTRSNRSVSEQFNEIGGSGGGGKASQDPEELKKHAKKGWAKLKAVARTAGKVNRRHQLNSTIFGVPSGSSEDYDIPDAPPTLRRFGAPVTQTRSLGGVVEPPGKCEVTKICMPSMLPTANLAYGMVAADKLKKMKAETKEGSMKKRATLSVSSAGGWKGGEGSSGSVGSLEEAKRVRRQKRTSSAFRDGGKSVGGARALMSIGGSQDLGSFNEDEEEEVETMEVVSETAEKKGPKGAQASEVVKEDSDSEVQKASAARSRVKSGASVNSPANWECRVDPSSMYPYYFNLVSGQGAWTPPENCSPSDASRFMSEYEKAKSDIEAAEAEKARAASAGGDWTKVGMTQEQWEALTGEQQQWYTWYGSLNEEQKAWYHQQ